MAGKRTGGQGGGGHPARLWSLQKRLRDRRAFQRRGGVGGAGTRPPPLLPPFLPCPPGPGADSPQAGTAEAAPLRAGSRRRPQRGGPALGARAPASHPTPPGVPTQPGGAAQSQSTQGVPGAANRLEQLCARGLPTRPRGAAGAAARWRRVSASCCAPCRYCCGAAWTPSSPSAEARSCAGRRR